MSVHLATVGEILHKLTNATVHLHSDEARITSVMMSGGYSLEMIITQTEDTGDLEVKVIFLNQDNSYLDLGSKVSGLSNRSLREICDELFEIEGVRIETEQFDENTMAYFVAIVEVGLVDMIMADCAEPSAKFRSNILDILEKYPKIASIVYTIASGQIRSPQDLGLLCDNKTNKYRRHGDPKSLI